MPRIIEIESKFEILDIKNLQDFLSTLTFIDKKRVTDQYYDTKEGNFFKQGVFIRNRDGKKLDFKFNLEDFQNQDFTNNHEHCDEFSYQFPITIDQLPKINRVCKILSLKPFTSTPDTSTNSHKSLALQKWLKDNFLKESILIDKVRKTYRDDTFLYQIDVVNKLGTFLEVEANVTERNLINQIKEEMKQRVKTLDLKLISTGYYELYLKKYSSDLYLQGKYVLEEDRS